MKTSGECGSASASRRCRMADLALASAGPLHLEGGRTPITLFPDDAGAFATATIESSFIVGGERLTFNADGAEVPGFSMTLTAPPTVQFAAPVPPPPSDTISVAADAGLAFAWYPASVSVFVGTDVLPSGGRLFSLGCSFKSTSGTGTVSAELLDVFPAGARFRSQGHRRPCPGRPACRPGTSSRASAARLRVQAAASRAGWSGTSSPGAAPMAVRPRRHQPPRCAKGRAGGSDGE